MQTNNALLSKKATKEALSGDWEAAIVTNLQILENDPKNIDAKLRLGHAYIRTKHINKARKEFKEVLDMDPINAVALKNLKIISEDLEVTTPSKANAGALIKEPGTTAEAQIHLVGRGNNAESFAPGEILNLDIKKRTVDVYRNRKDKDILIGTIDTEIPDNEDVIKGLNKALEAHVMVTASFVKGSDRDAELLIKAGIPVFKAEKQDIRPYIKKGSLDEEGEEEEENEVIDLS